jgi:hypothetical protein
MNWALVFILGSCLAMAIFGAWLNTRPESGSESKSEIKHDL